MLKMPKLLPVPALLLALTLAGGCSKEQPTVTPASTPSPDQTATAAPARPAPGSRAPAPQAPRPAVVADSGNVEANLTQLSLELRNFVVSTRTVPKNFEEFITKSRVQAPPPPAGKKYAIQGQAVVLVNR